MNIRTLLLAVPPLAALPWLASSVPVQDAAADPAAVRSLLEKWVETRKVISSEERDRALGREVLTERIRVVGQEIESVRRRIADLDASIAEASAKRVELAAEHEGFEDAAEAMRLRCAGLEHRTKELLLRLQPSVQERVRLFSARLPEDPANAGTRLGRRFESVVAILNELNKANNEVVSGSEVVALPDGTSAEVSILRVGLGQACYVGLANRVAGTGRGGSGTWTWKPSDTVALPVARAIAILDNREVAGFVPLPVEIE